MAILPRKIGVSDVVGPLSIPGVKVPASALDFGTGDGQVAEGSAVAVIQELADTATTAATAAGNRADAATTMADAAANTANAATNAAATAASRASDALAKANAAQATATTALNGATAAQSSADNATDLANAAQAAIAGATSKANTALSNSSTALTSANTASSVAADANTKASDAAAQAAHAAVAASDAMTAASSVAGQAADAVTRATQAGQAAAAATTAASTASAEARAAKAAADTATLSLTDANNKAASAVTTANAAQATATKASQDVAGAISAANGATAAATQASQAADAARVAAGSAQAAADTATASLAGANTKADTAVSTANAAAATANKASQDVAGALAAAGSATTAANNATVAATNAKIAADAATATAASVNTKADTAVATANAANVKAGTAQAAADTATSRANQALSTAQTAQATADAAASGVAAASSKADSAITTANAANSTAGAANTRATAAQTAASDAATKANTAQTAAAAASAAALAAQTAADTATSQISSAQATASAAASSAAAAATKADQALLVANGTAAMVQKWTFDASGFHAQMSDGSILNFVPASVTPPPGTAISFPLASAGALAATMPTTTLISIDPALPASQSPLTAGTPGIQLDANNDVIALTDAVGGLTAVSGWGRTRYTQGGPGGYPYFSSKDTGYHESWESFMPPLSMGLPMFGPEGAAWQMVFVMRQTGKPEQLVKIEYPKADNPNDHWHIYVTGVQDGDGRLHLEQNNGAIVADEPASSLSALNQWQVVVLACMGDHWELWRSGTRVLVTQPGTAGGFFSPPSNITFLNNARADVLLIQVSTGVQSITQMDARVKALAAHYGNLSVATTTEGSATAVPPAVVDATTDFDLVPNFPLSDTLPKRAAATPGAGITLTPGATQMFSMLIGSNVPGANITTSQQFRDNVYLHYISGNQNNQLAWDVTTGHYTPGETPFWGVGRHYAVGSPYDLHQVRGNGVHLRAISSMNRTVVAKGKIWSGMFRLGAAIRPGMFGKVRYKVGKGPNGWQSLWFYSGQQRTPRQFGSMDYYYNAGALLNFSPGGKSFEIDWNDGFSKADFGLEVGRALDTLAGVDIYGVAWQTPPYRQFMSTANGFGLVDNNFWNTTPANASLSDDFRDVYFNWRGDGSNLMDFGMMLPGIGFKVYQTAYMEFDQAATFTDIDGQVKKIGMHLICSNEPVPEFNTQIQNGVVPLDNDGIYGTGDALDGWTMCIQEISFWQGNLVNPESYR